MSSPLCVEEMDLSDRNFKPCPCGYQICQFCYNNIISNPDLNHNCPACRRVYSKDTVEYKVLSPDELNVLKLKQLEKQKKRKQKEKDARDAEQASKKHLAGMRVIQKNLVYVVGLNLPGSSEELQALFKTESYFGQYGKIAKVVVNRKPPSTTNPHSSSGLSVYVTFVRKEDALRCIQAVDGSISDGRALKAAHGTTKYCSSYLRGQQCPNPNCMFLHEPGEEAVSYNRENMSNRRIHSEVRSAIHGLAPPLTASTPTLNNASLASSASIHDQYSNFNNVSSAAPASTASTNTSASQYNYKADEDQAEEEPTSQVALPATANWAKGSFYSNNASSVSTPVDNPDLSTAFPTLGESIQLIPQPTSSRESKKKEKRRDEEYMDSATAAITLMKRIVEGLNNLDVSFVKFKDESIDQEEFKKFPRLFSYKSQELQKPRENTKDISNSIVDNLLVNKTNSHIMGIQTIQGILQYHQQQQRLQQQQQQLAQLQQKQQPKNIVGQDPVAQQQYLLQQQRLQRLQQQPQSTSAANPAANLALLQQQQLGLGNQQNLYQQQPQQQQQQQQQQAAILAAQQMKVTPSNSSSGGPPGLFSGVSLGQESVDSNANNNAASSELLSHLLSGKR